MARFDVRVTDKRPAILISSRKMNGQPWCQRLDHYQSIASAPLLDVPWDAASSSLLPSTNMTITGIAKPLAWAEDRWFQGRLPCLNPRSPQGDHQPRVTTGSGFGYASRTVAPSDGIPAGSPDSGARCTSLAAREAP